MTDDRLPPVRERADGKRDLLARLLKERSAAAPESGRTEGSAATESGPGPARYPLSFSQRRLWFFDQLTPGTATYNIPLALRIAGALDVPALERSLTEILRRHDVLRAAVESVDGTPFQIVTPPAPVPLPLVDLRDVPAELREGETRRVTEETARAPFDLALGPLIRSTLVRTADAAHVLILVMHHVVSDAWSLRILVNELLQAYGAFASGRPSPLPLLPMQYPEFARWQREALGGGVLAEDLAYWKQQLAGAPHVTELASDRPRGEQQTFRGASEVLALPAPLADDLKALSRREGVTAFMTLLAAFQLLVSRLTGQKDVVIGSPVAGRTRPETEGLIGCFVNTVALRTDLSDGPAFTTLLQRVRRTCLDAYAHQDLPFDTLVEELQPTRDPKRSPLFQILFNMVVPQAARIELPGLTIDCVHPDEDTSKFDVTMYAMDTGGTIHLQLAYNADLFERPAMGELLRQYERLLQQIAANPAEAVGRYSLRTPFGETRLPDPVAPLRDAPAPAVPAVFVEQARQTPERVALRHGTRTVGYGELEHWSRAVAQRLRASGFGPEQIAVLYADRSPGLVAALLGVLRAGGAFAIIDPSYPPARIIGCLDLIQPAAWIDVQAAGDLPPGLAAHVEGLTLRCRFTAEDAASPAADEAPDRPVGPEDLAYVAFTSGTSGKPKAILGTHGPLAHFMQWHRETFDFSGDDRFSMLSGLAHDPLLRDVFAPLSVGAALCIPEEGRIAWSEGLFDWLATSAITVAHLTPPLLRLLESSARHGSQLPALRYAFFGGEALRARDAAALRRLAPSSEWVNFYGTTETPQAIAWFRDEDGSVLLRRGEDDMRPLPIGRGIDGVQLLVLNEEGNLTAAGEPGEICVRTHHLARGYLGPATDGASRFGLNPFTSDHEDRLYRTGDLGRYDVDGNVEFIGRADLQVKVRGYRVELAEIEGVLRTLPGVRDALVVARTDGAEVRLVAYVQVEAGATAATEDLRRAAGEQLPDYMVPSAFVALTAFPLTANGKIDRASLPDADDLRPALETAYVAPRTPVEEIVADVWSGLLGWRRVGVHDNFFALGGHSLLATQVMSRLRDAFGIKLPLRRLFQTPTVAGLAAAVQDGAANATAARPIARVSRQGELPLSLAQERLWFIDQLEPGSAAYNMVGAARLTGSLDVEALRWSLREIVRRHETLRTTFPAIDGQPVMRILEDLPDPLTVLSAAADTAAVGAELERLLRIEAARPFTLATEPPFRAVLVQTGSDEHVLVAVTHHIASDLWSIGVLVRELGALYRARVAGQPSPLPELPVQYVDFAAWQREWVECDEFIEQIAYWREQLRSAPGALEIQADRLRPPVQTQRGARLSFTWPADLVHAARVLSQREGLTLYMTLLAAFQALLHRYTGREDIVVGAPIAGRTRVESEPLIGFFVNLLPLRTQLDGTLTFRELLARTRETCLGAYAHQDVPFDRLVQELKPERDLSRNPIVQVVLALQNAVIEPLELPGVRLTPITHGNPTARFDLAVFLHEAADGISGSVEYSTDLFDASTIEAFITRYRRLLESAVAHPATPVARLTLSSDAERADVLAAAAGSHTVIQVHDPVPCRVARQAQLRPDAPAVVSAQGLLTFSDLNRRANRLARVLARQGIAPERPCIVYMERSLEMIVALLAVWRAGGAYVPVDTTHPAERLAFTIADAQASVVVTQPRFETRIAAGSARVITLPADGEAFADESDDDIVVPVRAANLAYVIYTSGSTGQPKGVQITHGGLVNLVEWHQRTYAVTPADRATHLAGVGFDASVWEIWPYLAAGASVHLPQPQLLASPASLWTWLAAERITLGFVPTPLAEALLGESVPADISLRALLTGGDRLIAAPRHALPFAFVNHYGPTENSVVSTFGEVASSPGDGPPPSIGRAIDNVHAYVLDVYGEPVPSGVPGELYVGGASLARGYLRRPDLTAERFVPDPFGGEPGARLYRTGDLVRYSTDGSLHFLGRNDNQVKVRGFRIELGEIEAVLTAHPGVAGAVVVSTDGAAGTRLAAYVVPADRGTILPSDIRTWLSRRLPEYMLPSAIVALPALPLTANGKIDRRALPAVQSEAQAGVAPRTDLEQRIAAVWAEVLGVDRVGVEDNFFDLGGHSLLLIRLHKRLSESISGDLSIVDLFQYPTVAGLAARLVPASTVGEIADSRAPRRDRQSGAVAIIGMAGRFPGAPDIDRFWANLLEGIEGISVLDDAELAAQGIDPVVLSDPAYVKARGVLDAPEAFDAPFFGYTPREAESIDPQQRVFLECAWEALEDAGYDAAVYQGEIGVFAGTGANTYLLQALGRSGQQTPEASVQLALSSEKDFLATRVSYKLGLRGPAVTVQSACSTSLVAVHLARRSLLSGDCDIAIVGGVRIAFPQVSGYLYQEGSILSSDGHCRAFDAKASGTVGGNGAAAVVLKRMEDARRDGDSIYAVIRGSAVNNDGAAKVGYTAPSVEGQAEVIARAQAEAGVDPGTIGYVEAHGTGTSLGDPVEVAALARAFGKGATRDGSCAIGSLKTNVGHLDAAAGVAGLVKAALTVQQGVIPPSLHFDTPNPQIDFASTPFYVSTETHRWKDNGLPRRAGVSSFGLGGTNAHVVLEQPPAAEASGTSREWQALVVSARTERALEAATDRIAGHLRARPDEPLADVAYTLSLGRRRFAWRRAVIARTSREAAEALAARDPRRVIGATNGPPRAGVVFVFPGQGSQHVGMVRGIYESESTFRADVDLCAAALERRLGFDIRPLLFADGSNGAAAPSLDDTAVAQPALFTVEYALARLWMRWGIEPDAMIGHSVGEFVAACLSGVMTFEDALELVAERGRLMQEMPRGSMLAVALPEADLRALLGPGLSVAAVNGPSQCVASGPDADIAALEGILAARGVERRRLQTSHAFHSPMMDPAADRFAARTARVRLEAPRIPYISNVTGTWVTAAQATSADYWVQHLRAPVRFADGLACILRDPDRVLLEVGPGQVLTGLARDAARAAGATAIASLRHPRDAQADQAALLSALARLWVAGAHANWTSFYAGERRRRVKLPTYPFEREYYSLLRAHAREGTQVAATREERRRMPDWLYVPAWARTPRPLTSVSALAGTVLLFVDGSATGEALDEILGRRGASVIRVRPGSAFARVGPDYAIDPRQPDDYVAVWDDLVANGCLPRRVVHLWQADETADDRLSTARFDAAQDRGFYSLVWLARAIGRTSLAEPLELVAVTNGVCDVTGLEPLHPERATVHGVCKVIPHEYPGLRCRTIDIATSGASSAGTAEALAAEIVSGAADPMVALRAGHRWTPAFAHVRPGSDDSTPLLRDRGVYLITGGLGGVGLELARDLARTVRARLALVSRRTVPPRAEWEALASRPDAGTPGRTLQLLLDLETSGAELLVIQADAADDAALGAAIAQTQERFGALHGVIHAAGADKTAVPLSVLGRASGDEQFRARAHALIALERALDGQALDFCVIQSSLASVLGVPGHAAYTAAHSFVDGFAARANRAGGTRWLCINWDNWRTWKSEAVQDARDLSLTADEGCAVFRAILALDDARQVVVSTGDLQARLERWVTSVPAAQAVPEARASARHARRALSSGYVAPSTGPEQALAAIWEELLGIDRVGVADNFFELGGDSLIGIQIVARAAAAGIRLSVRDTFDHPTVAELAAAARVGSAHAAPEAVDPADVPLTPIQQWFFDADLAEPQHFNQARMLRVRDGIEPAAVETALRAIVEHHQALQTAFVRRTDGWRQVGRMLDSPVVLARFDVSALEGPDRAAAFERIGAELQGSLDFTAGPIVRAAWFDGGPEYGARLLIVIHHLVVDVISWRIVIEDLGTACGQLQRGEQIVLPDRTTAFAQWAARLATHAVSPQVDADVPYWTGRAWSRVAPLPRDPAEGDNTEGSTDVVRVSLDAGDTQTLFESLRGCSRIQPQDALVGTLGLVCRQWVGLPAVLLDVEMHGRDVIEEGVDVSRTVGWFTNIVPVLLELEGVQTPQEAVLSAARQFRAIPSHGLTFGLIRHLRRDDEARNLRGVPAAEISLLYLGRQDQAASGSAPFVPAHEPFGPTRSPQARRGYLLEVSAFVLNGRLETTWRYSRAVHRPQTIERLARDFVVKLGELARCPILDDERREVAEFPAARLSQDELQDVLAILNRSGAGSR